MEDRDARICNEVTNALTVKNLQPGRIDGEPYARQAPLIGDRQWWRYPSQLLIDV